MKASILIMWIFPTLVFSLKAQTQLERTSKESAKFEANVAKWKDAYMDRKSVSM